MNSSKGKQHANYILMLKALSVEIGHFSLKDVNLVAGELGNIPAT